MGVSKAENLLFLTLAISLLLLGFFPSPFYSAPLCFGRFFKCNIEDRRLPFPPSPVTNKMIRQDSPRAPPIRAQSTPPSPTTLI